MKDLKNNTLATFPQIKITKIPGKAQTGKNVMQDGKPMYKRKDGKVVERGLWSNVYLSNRKQEGGTVEQQQPDLMSLFSWFAENVPDDDFNSPEDVAKEFQQLSPEQQQQFIASIQQQMGTMQIGGDNTRVEKRLFDKNSIINPNLKPSYDFGLYNSYQTNGLRNISSEDSLDYKNYFNRGKMKKIPELEKEIRILEQTVYSGDQTNNLDKLPYYKKLNAYRDLLKQKNKYQYGGMSVNASPTKKYQEGENNVSQLGYSDGSPYLDYEMLPIDSNYLTMENTGIPLMGVGNQSGEMQYMNPYSGDYYFPNDENVTEYPLAQTGSKKQTSVPIDYDHLYYMDNWKYDNLDYSSFNQKAPIEFTEEDFPTPPINQIRQKALYNFSDANISQRTVDSFANTMNDISALDPKLIQRNTQGNIPTSSESNWDKIIDLKRDSPFEYAPMLQNYTNALNQDPQYRATANIKGAFTPELDVRGAIQAIDDELKDSMRNVDMNNTAGAAIAAQLQANASKNKLNVINDAAQKNAQIRGQNSQSEANRQNQQNQLQQQFNAQYYDNILRSRSASQQEKNRALNALLSRREQKDAFETNLAVATMPYNNFKYKPGEGVFRNNKTEFYVKEIEAKKAEEEEKKKVKKQMGGWGNKFKFKNV